MSQSSPTPHHPGSAMPSREAYVSVDVETAGPNPSTYSLLAIGACLALDTGLSFYAELQPASLQSVPEAMQVNGLSLAELAAHGLPPQIALQQLESWVLSVCRGAQPVFVGLNAAFDWMFVNDYFHRFLGHNPFGHAALDLKAYYAGRTGRPWAEATMKHMAARYHLPARLTHHARQDAIDQAELFRLMLAEAPSPH